MADEPTLQRLYVGQPYPYVDVKDFDPVIWTIDPRPGHAAPLVHHLVLLTILKLGTNKPKLRQNLWGQSELTLQIAGELITDSLICANVSLGEAPVPIEAAADVSEILSGFDPFKPFVLESVEIRRIASRWDIKIPKYAL